MIVIINFWQVRGGIFEEIKSVLSCNALVSVPPNIAMCNSEGNKYTGIPKFKSSHPEVFLRKAVLKICSKFKIEHPCRITIWINVLVCNFIEIALWNGCSLVNLLYIFRKAFLKNTPGWLLLWIILIVRISPQWASYAGWNTSRELNKNIFLPLRSN